MAEERKWEKRDRKVNEMEHLEVEECFVEVLKDYLLWILDTAEKRGLKRLYFLSRDGYLLYHGALQLCGEMEYRTNVEYRYLECSRFSLRLPLYHKDHEDALSYLCRGGIDISIRHILKRAGLSDPETAMFARKLERETGLDRDHICGYQELRQIAERLKKSKSFWNIVDKHSKREWEFASAYLKQEGVLEPCRIGIADSGWTGGMQKELLKYREVFGVKEPVFGIYWGLYELPEEIGSKEYATYFFDHRRGMLRKLLFNNCVFECLFSAPQGMTLGYRPKGEEITPQYAKTYAYNVKWIEDFEKEFLSGLKRTCKQDSMAGNQEIATDGRDHQEKKRKAMRRLLRFMMFPTKEEADRYGKLLFCDDVLEEKMQELAPLMSSRKLWEGHVAGKVYRYLQKKNVADSSAWYNASAVRNGRLVKWHSINHILYKALLLFRKQIRKEIPERG